ncbi:hypothetical protein GCM10009557_32740 [Virgisporangium ochraceum]
MKLLLPARATNLALLAALAVVFATGAGAVASGTAAGRWVVIGHGAAGLLVVLLVPAKLRVVRAGLRAARRTRWLSLALAAFVVAVLLLGFGYSTGFLRTVGGLDALWLHIALALALVPVLLWHLVARFVRPRRADLSRRTALRTGLVADGAVGLDAATAGAVEATGAPGARRRFTGSYERGSFRPAEMPNTIWLNDTAPPVDPGTWRLTVTVTGVAYPLTDLSGRSVTRRALLDCTSGWYAEQDWQGVPLRDLMGRVGDARSVVVRSRTGYAVRFPVDDLDTLFVAVGVAGRPLSRGHGFPARLVAPGRRGFWWVKWVETVELSEAPWWWQSPFPLT